MFKSCRIASWVIAMELAVILSGCNSRAPHERQNGTTPAEKSVQKTPAVPSEQADHATHEGQEQAGPAPAGMPTGLAGLSAADRAAAEKQRVCPVSGDVLGAMGKPYKVTVKGQVVFLCCQACEREIMKNPDKYLAKLTADEPK